MCTWSDWKSKLRSADDVPCWNRRLQSTRAEWELLCLPENWATVPHPKGSISLFSIYSVWAVGLLATYLLLFWNDENCIYWDIIYVYVIFQFFLSNNVRQFGPVKNKVKNNKTATICGLYFCNERKFLLLTMSNLIVLTWPYLKQACPAPTSNKCG